MSALMKRPAEASCTWCAETCGETVHQPAQLNMQYLRLMKRPAQERAIHNGAELEHVDEAAQKRAVQGSSATSARRPLWERGQVSLTTCKGCDGRCVHVLTQPLRHNKVFDLSQRRTVSQASSRCQTNLYEAHHTFSTPRQTNKTISSRDPWRNVGARNRPENTGAS